MTHNGKEAKAGKNGRIKAVAYLRTSSAANVGADKDSDKRQRAAIAAFAKRARFEIAADDWFYDPASERSGPGRDAAMLRKSSTLAFLAQIRQAVAYEARQASARRSRRTEKSVWGICYRSAATNRCKDWRRSDVRS